MPTKFFAISAMEPQRGEDELNTFLGSQRVVKVERHLVERERGAVWCIAVDYLRGAGEAPEVR